MSNFAQDFVVALDDAGADIIVIFIVDVNNLRAQEADLLAVFCYHASWRLLRGCLLFTLETETLSSSPETDLMRRASTGGNSKEKGAISPFDKPILNCHIVASLRGLSL